MAASSLLLGASPPGRVEARLDGLRSGKGAILACLTRDPEHFPDCQDDVQARHVTLPTAAAQNLVFSGLPSGDYAIALIHDENGNGRLDTVLGIPREGFGFSRNPAIRFGPPKFGSAAFAVASGAVDESIRVKYMF